MKAMKGAAPTRRGVLMAGGVVAGGFAASALIPGAWAGSAGADARTGTDKAEAADPPEEAKPAVATSDEARSAKLERSIDEVRPGVYRTRENRHCGLLIVGDNGVAVFDTLNAEFAGWLDSEIAKRFQKPVRYVIYSHNHPDHISGGEMFDQHRPTYIAQRFARDSMVRMKVATRIPETTFDDRLDIRIDGIRIELRYHGANEGRGSISLLVPEKRVLSAVDWLVINRVPYRDLARFDIDGMIRSLYDISHLDFEVAVPGHGDMGGKAHVAVSRRYLETVRDGVIAGILANKPLDLIVREVRAKLTSVPQFRALRQFEDWVDLNIRGAYRQLASVEGFLDG